MANGNWRMTSEQGAVMVDSQVKNQPSGTVWRRSVSLIKLVFLILALLFVGLLLAEPMG